MNICFVLIEYPISLLNGEIVKDFSGGAGAIMHDIAHGIKKLGHNVYILARSIGIKYDHSFNDNGIEVYKFSAKDHISLTLKMTEFLKQITINKNIDIIETCDYAPLISEYVENIPILLRQHISHAYLEYYAGKITSPYEVKNINYLHYIYSLHLADSIVGVSRFILENQSKFHEFPSEKIYGVIYNGIKNIPISENDFNPYLFFCHGTVSERKGTHKLCDIFNSISLEKPYTGLKIIGTGEKFWNKSCIPLLSENAKNRVTYIDYLSRNDVLKEISKAGIYISMSCLEAMSISMLEAMALGKPLILLKNGSFEEFVEDGVEGFIVSDEQEAIKRAIELIDDENLYKQFSKSAKTKATKYTLNNCVLETEKWYRTILEDKSGILSKRNNCFNALLKEYYRYASKLTIS
jgi:glycosyltransferase involved in cell wall biosynthesis